MSKDEHKARREFEHRLHVNINERQRAIGAWEKGGQEKFEHWLYEGKRMIDELRRLPILFRREREGTLPQNWRYCSMSPGERLPVLNELMCCLGVKTAECEILRDAFKGMEELPPEMVDDAKAHVCVAHVLRETFSGKAIDTSEGYITDSTERAFWQRTYEVMAMEPPEPPEGDKGNWWGAQFCPHPGQPCIDGCYYCGRTVPDSAGDHNHTKVSRQGEPEEYSCVCDTC